jgi:hypothetical protein
VEGLSRHSFLWKRFLVLFESLSSVFSFHFEHIELDGKFRQEVVVRRAAELVALKSAAQGFNRTRVLFDFIQHLFDG